QFSDINFLRISKTGDDGMCVKAFSLLINGSPAYVRDFSGLSAGCRWFDTDSSGTPSYTVAGATLRADARWRAYTQPEVPTSLSRTELESRIEGGIGSFMYDNRLYWGHLHGRAVEVSYKDAGTLHVDLDLAYDSILPDPEVDVDFDVAI